MSYSAVGWVFNNSSQLCGIVVSGLPVTLCSWGEVRLSCRPPSCLSAYTHTSLSSSLPRFFLSLFQKSWQLQTKQGLWADWHILPLKGEHLTRLTPSTAHHTHTHTHTHTHKHTLLASRNKTTLQRKERIGQRLGGNLHLERGEKSWEREEKEFFQVQRRSILQPAPCHSSWTG